MKISIRLSVMGALFLFSSLAMAEFSSVKDYSDVCKGYQIVRDGDALACRKADSYAEVKSAKVGRNVEIPEAIAQNFVDAMDLEVIPDADTNMIYLFRRELLNSSGRLVGYTEVLGYENSEMGIKLQLNARYNLKGELVYAYIKETN